MKFGRILLILVIVVVAVFAGLFLLLPQGEPPIEITKFNGGNPLLSDVTVTDVFQVKEGKWSIDLATGSTFPGWSLDVELFKEGGGNPLCSLKGKWDVLLDRVVWELDPGTTGGTFKVPYEYQLDLPLGRYYLKIHWTRTTWTIFIFEEPSR